MSRNAIGHRDNGKVYRQCCCPSEKSPRHRGPTYKCLSSDWSPWNFRVLCILQTQYDNYDYDAPEIAVKETRNSLATSQIEEWICWFARTVWENLLYSRCLNICGTCPRHKWIIHAATQCTHAWATSY